MERLLLPIAWRERETNGETTSFGKQLTVKWIKQFA